MDSVNKVVVTKSVDDDDQVEFLLKNLQPKLLTTKELSDLIEEKAQIEQKIERHKDAIALIKIPAQRVERPGKSAVYLYKDAEKKHELLHELDILQNSKINTFVWRISTENKDVVTPRIGGIAVDLNTEYPNWDFKCNLTKSLSLVNLRQKLRVLTSDKDRDIVEKLTECPTSIVEFLMQDLKLNTKFIKKCFFGSEFVPFSSDYENQIMRLPDDSRCLKILENKKFKCAWYVVWNCDSSVPIYTKYNNIDPPVFIGDLNLDPRHPNMTLTCTQFSLFILDAAYTTSLHENNNFQ